MNHVRRFKSMGYVINTNDDTTDLVILNAQDFEAAPVARVRLPRRVPFGAHGSWLPA